MPRFVILRHETPPGYPRPTHFDLMLEQGDMLWTWAMEELPIPGKSITAERLRDHRAEYLDFQGDVSGDRGSVNRVDHGEYQLLEQTADRLLVRMQGAAVQSTIALENDRDAQRWRVSISGD